MTIPAGFPPTPPGGANQNAIIAAAPGDPLGEALATAFRALGWRAVVTDQAPAYAHDARLCVAIISPASVNSPATAAALAAPVAALVPLVLGSTPLPGAAWSTGPVAFSGQPDQAARAIVGAVATLPPPISYPSAPTGGYATPTATFSGPATPFAAAPTLGGTAPMAAAPQPYQPPAAYGQYGQRPAPSAPQPYVTPATPPRRSRVGLIIGVVVAVLLLLCVVASLVAYPRVALAIKASQTATALARATATPKPTATPSLPPGFTRYTDPAGAFTIGYPSGWQTTSSRALATFTDTTTRSSFVISSVASNFSPSDITANETQFFQSISPSGTVSNVRGPTTVTYAGEQWTKETADVTVGSVTLTATALVANHGPNGYIIGYAAYSQFYARFDQQDFQPMLGTLTFLG